MHVVKKNKPSKRDNRVTVDDDDLGNAVPQIYGEWQGAPPHQHPSQFAQHQLQHQQQHPAMYRASGIPMQGHPIYDAASHHSLSDADMRGGFALELHGMHYHTT